MNIILIGVQGSGKGTQAEHLSEHYKIPTLSVGELLRECAREGDPLCLKAKEYWVKGNLSPDELVNEILEKEISKEKYSKGIILDGYPRHLGQAKALEAFIRVDRVVVLDIPDELGVRRISSRVQCRKCGRVFGIDIPPKKKGVCDECGGEIYRREDDSPEKVKHRIELYHRESEPVIEYYRPRGIVVEVDASKPIKEVFNEIVNKLSVHS